MGKYRSTAGKIERGDRRRKGRKEETGEGIKFSI